MVSTDKNILIVTYWSYKSALIKTYTLPYVELIQTKLPHGSKVCLMTLTPEAETNEADYELNRKALLEKNIRLVNFTYRPFGFGMGIKLLGILFYLVKFIEREKISTIHAWCTPGGAIGYILSRLTGKPLVLDSFEPHAESMLETGTWKKNSLAYRLLFRLEKLQLKRASHVICAAPGMIAYSEKTYDIKKEQYFVKPACVDLELFKRDAVKPLSISEITPASIVCVYAGKFGDIYLSGEVFDFFAIARSFWGERFKVLLLTNQSDQEIRSFCEQSGLPFETVIKKFVAHDEVPAYMALGDFGICPVKSVPTKKYCTPIKNGEYWAMGLPVVITRDISVDSALIEEQDIGYVLKELKASEYLEAVKKTDVLLQRKELSAKIRAVAEKHRNYSIANSIYAAIYG
jgi:glycosyltransferase involved in cell wall biosynthesis